MAFKMKGHSLPGPNQKQSPTKHAGDDNYEHHDLIKSTKEQIPWYKVKKYFFDEKKEHKKFERGSDAYKKRQLTVHPGDNFITEEDGTRVRKTQIQQKKKVIDPKAPI